MSIEEGEATFLVELRTAMVFVKELNYKLEILSLPKGKTRPNFKVDCFVAAQKRLAPHKRATTVMSKSDTLMKEKDKEL